MKQIIWAIRTCLVLIESIPGSKSLFCRACEQDNRSPLSWRRSRGLIFGLALAGSAVSSASGAPINVFAAASIGEIITEIGDSFTEETGVEVRVIIAGSATLAQQIVAGAPADVFISANREWVNYARENSGFGPGRDLFSNALVVIAPANSDIILSDLAGLPQALGGGRLALGDPAYVPGGEYARQALQDAEIWDEVKNQLAPGVDVRAALRLVMAGATPLGIVYATDTRGTDVKIIWEMDPAGYDKISYVASLAPEGRPESEQFFDFLRSDEAQSLASAYGYITGAGG